MMEKRAILYGTVYHPERYPDSRDKVAEDIRLMRQMHFNAVILSAEALSYARVTAGGDGWYDRLAGALIAGGMPVIVEVPWKQPPSGMIRSLAAQHGVLGFLQKRPADGEGAPYRDRRGFSGCRLYRPETEGFRAQLKERVHFLKEEAPGRKVMAEMPASELLKGGAPYGEADAFCFGYNPLWMEGTVQESGRDSEFFLDRIRTAAGESFYVNDIDPVSCGDGRRKRPGILTLEILQAAARGGRGFFFREWRQSPSGPDRYAGAVLDHAGRTGSPWAKEAEQIGRMLQEWSELPPMKVRTGCALLYTGENPAGQAMKYYRMLRNLGLSVDVAGRGHVDERYPLTAAPSLPVVSPEEAERIRSYVKDGGTWIAGGAFALEKEEGVCYEEPVPALLTDVFGIEINDRDLLPERGIMPLKPSADFRGRYHARKECWLLGAKDAEVLARYGSLWYKDTPAVTRKLFGKGYAYYVGSVCDDEFCYDMLNKIIRGQKRLPRVKIAEDLSMLRLEDPEAEYILFQNLTDRERRLPLDYNRLDILFGYDPIPAFGTMMLKVQEKKKTGRLWEGSPE